MQLFRASVTLSLISYYPFLLLSAGYPLRIVGVLSSCYSLSPTSFSRERDHLSYTYAIVFYALRITL